MTLARKMSGDSQRFRPIFRPRMHFDERRLPLDKIAFVQIHDLDDIDQFIELFHNLLDNPVIPGCHDGHHAT